MNKKKFFTALLTAAVLLTCGGFTTSFAVEEHPVTYDADGGIILGEQIKSVRWCDKAETPYVRKENYVFEGWTDGHTLMRAIVHARNAVNLKAVYKPEVYELKFMDGERQISATNYAYGQTENLSVFAEGYATAHPYENFKCWKDEEGNEITAVDSETFGNKILSAVYEGKEYSIEYDLNGGNAEGLPDTYQYGTGVESFPDASAEGKVFDGWFTDAEFTEAADSISADSHGNRHLYAKFHDAPVVKASSTGRSYSRRSAYSGSTSSNSGNYNYSVGVTIPRMGYHVDNTGGDEAIDAENAIAVETFGIEYWQHDDGSYACFDVVAGESTEGLHRAVKNVLLLGDHASQGLSNLGNLLQPGDKLYLNGKEYTYSGYCNICLDYLGGIGQQGFLENGYNLMIRTCTDASGTLNYCCFFY